MDRDLNRITSSSSSSPSSAIRRTRSLQLHDAQHSSHHHISSNHHHHHDDHRHVDINSNSSRKRGIMTTSTHHSHDSSRRSLATTGDSSSLHDGDNDDDDNNDDDNEKQTKDRSKRQTRKQQWRWEEWIQKWNNHNHHHHHHSYYSKRRRKRQRRQTTTKTGIYMVFVGFMFFFSMVVIGQLSYLRQLVSSSSSTTRSSSGSKTTIVDDEHTHDESYETQQSEIPHRFRQIPNKGRIIDPVVTNHTHLKDNAVTNVGKATVATTTTTTNNTTKRSSIPSTKIISVRDIIHIDHNRNGYGSTTSTTTTNFTTNTDTNDDNDYDTPLVPVAVIYSGKVKKYSCNQLFGWNTIKHVWDRTCIYHRIVKWYICQLGPRIWIDTSKIDGSVGGDDPITSIDARFRDVEEELLSYDTGALIIPSTITTTTTTMSAVVAAEQQQQQPHIQQFMLPPILQDDRPAATGLDEKMVQFLNSFQVANVTTTVTATAAAADGDANGDGGIRVESNGEVTSRLAQTTTTATTTPNGVTFLVRRGDYANPCFAMITMYHVFMAIQMFDLMDISKNIVWLDGHAKGDLDVVWEQLFDTIPKHVLQLADNNNDNNNKNKTTNLDRVIIEGSDGADNDGIVRLENPIIVDTRSHLGDEGMNHYRWRRISEETTTDCSLDPSQNTLVAFRDFVLRKYGLERKQILPMNDKDTVRPRQLTLLVRKDYVSNPRSNGKTDRVLANVTDDLLYLQSIYEDYSISVVSFEGMEFVKQLEYITRTDVLVSVHGAGNVHAMFLPDHATFVEYFPPKFTKRRRFKYISECLNITYQMETAHVVERFDDGSKVSVRLSPLPKHNNHTILSQQDMMSLLDTRTSKFADLMTKPNGHADN